MCKSREMIHGCPLAPKEVSEAHVESFHTAIGTRALEAVLIAKAVL